LKQHQNDGVIIACGSAITVLIKHGVIPDFHILQERTWNREIMLRYASEATFSKITAFKLNVIETSLDDLYKDVLIFQKAKDPGSCLLDLQKHPVSTSVNPTVTNAGISFAASLGAKNVYLFGVDYGSPIDQQYLHAQGTIVNRDDTLNKDSQFILEGIYSDRIISDEILTWSHKTSEDTIMRHPQINWVNVGDGALIRTTKNIQPEALAKSFKTSVRKAQSIQAIKRCFDADYSYRDIADDLQQRHIQEAMDYLNAILDCFDTAPSTRCGIMKNIELISKAALIGSEQENYMPQKLFGHETLRFLDLLYTHVAITTSDQQAVDFYINSIEIFKQHAEQIFTDFQQIIHATIESPAGLN
jgi:hypothetical protein